MKEQICFEHHLHDDGCFVDREAIELQIRERRRKNCELGAYHASIKLDDSWSFCPLCGDRIR